MGLDKRTNKIRIHRNDKKKSEIQGMSAFLPHGIMDVIDNHPKNIFVSTPTTTTNTQVPSHDTTTEIIPTTREISEQLTLLPYQNTNSFVRDFLAKISQSLESEQVSKVLEAHYSMRFAESLGLRNLAIYSLRTSVDFSQPMTEKPFSPSSDVWMTWGMTVNGKCLTARITESPKIESASSLSDILEESVDQKYFLSEKTVKRLGQRMEDGWGKPTFAEQSLKV
jgi:hypothetical protein